MDEKLSFRQFLFPYIFMLLVGWGGLVLLMNYTLPFVWARWAFYFLLTIALTATALPVTYFLNLRFPSDPPAGPEVIIRQAIWFGVYGAALVWLWQVRTFIITVGLAVGLIIIEWLIRMRERSRWRPKQVTEYDPIDEAQL